MDLAFIKHAVCDRKSSMRAYKGALWLGLLCSACSFGPGNVHTSHSTDLQVRNIRRIAVMPPEMQAGKAPVPFTANRSDKKSPEEAAPDLLARQVYSEMTALPGWQIVSEQEAREVSQSTAQADEATRLRRLGELAYADAVITGRVVRYRERIGNEVGAKSPASIAFVLQLVDVRRGDVIWSARFDETQQSLSENLFTLGDIGERGIRWLSADQLMAQGVKKTVGQLHQLLVRPQN